MIQFNPYLSFQNTAREALEFYRSVLGGELVIDEFGSYPNEGLREEEHSLVMHGQLITDDGLVIMASDTPSIMPYRPAQGISLSVSGDDLDTLSAWWGRLSHGGEVTLPFEPAPWGGRFGMFTDRFGIPWMFSSTV